MKNLTTKHPSSTCFVRNDPRPKLVYKESETSRRREYTFVEAVRSLDHQLTKDDLRKAYQIAGQKFTGNLFIGVLLAYYLPFGCTLFMFDFTAND